MPPWDAASAATVRSLFSLANSKPIQSFSGPSTASSLRLTVAGLSISTAAPGASVRAVQR